VKIPQVYPTSKCKLRLLKLERIKDYLLMEEEFIRNQELLRPREEKNEVLLPSLTLTEPNIDLLRSPKDKRLMTSEGPH
jgi:hypothetical protein